MFRRVTALCVIVTFVVIFEQISCHQHGWHHHRRHHGHHRHHHGPHHHRGMFLNVEIYEPKGMQLSVAKFNSTAEYFGFDMFINNPDGGSPDVSQNTSTVTYGKYIVRDTEVIIKSGDVLNITHYMGFSDGGVLQSTITFPVFRHMIRNNCTCENTTVQETTSRTPIQSIPPWSRPTTIPPRITLRPTPPIERTTVPTTISPNLNIGQSINDYSDELFDCEIDPTTNLCSESSLIDARFGQASRRQPEKLVNNPDTDVNMNVFLEIFNALSDQCTTKTRTNFLTLASPGYTTNASTDWIGYVRRMLKERLNLNRLADKGLVDAQPSGTAIVFEMDTLFNKMQVLYYARKFGITSVKDYDDM
ncbi:uncharacterized protein LOC125761942 [Anopheles funestus]|uniref:uncharacterized protein LOC125761942 n=1 Tax=Anopheles funestus TaxID=62324 RepID=UPI0020C65FE6|nr:uncharacterized protein LOC125761942 [Anopheles funestus]